MMASLSDTPRHHTRAAVSGALLLTLLASACATTGAAPTPEGQANQWETDIRAFEAADRADPPAPGGVVFVGSSSIRLWDSLAEDFAGIPVINRGFGGSEMEDALHFADRIILPYRPRMVVVYAGDNDLWNGESPQRVLEDFRALVATIHQELPETEVAFIAVKPSVARWSIAGKVRRTNQLVRGFAESEPRVDYLDIATPMLGADGRPRPELFVQDGLHLNDRGYDLWEAVVEPYLRQGEG